jgi:hypothetical protein
LGGEVLEKDLEGMSGDKKTEKLKIVRIYLLTK